MLHMVQGKPQQDAEVRRRHPAFRKGGSAADVHGDRDHVVILSRGWVRVTPCIIIAQARSGGMMRFHTP